MINTRFNPTVNGPLHLGHLYICLVNEHEAHNTGGRFVVRFDDTQRLYTAMHGEAQLAVWRDAMRRDLDQYMTVDAYTSESAYWMTLHQRPAAFRAEVRQPMLIGAQGVMDTATVIGQQDPYPFVPEITAEKVYLDAIEGITMLIRGIDLLSEYALYEYFRARAGVPTVRHIYLPRLHVPKNPPTPSMAKTFGTHRIADMTKKYGRDSIMEILRVSCLNDPEGAFNAGNVKAQPKLAI